jgi:hypothetical protein
VPVGHDRSDALPLRNTRINAGEFNGEGILTNFFSVLIQASAAYIAKTL